jgi:hypothetical protein
MKLPHRLASVCLGFKRKDSVQGASLTSRVACQIYLSFGLQTLIYGTYISDIRHLKVKRVLEIIDNFHVIIGDLLHHYKQILLYSVI